MSLHSFIGASSGLKVQRGALIEYAMDDMLVLEFEFNPSSITRKRSVKINKSDLPGARGGYDFTSPSEASRAAQGASAGPEMLEIKILLDATDRMNAGDPVVSRFGVQPEIDMIRTMLEPKSQQPSGVKILTSLGNKTEKSFSQHQTMSVLLFKWGIHMFPVFLTSATIEMKAYLPTLIPYRAEAMLTLQIIESDNPFYNIEMKRQANMAMPNSKTTMESGLIGGLPGGKHG